MAHCNSKPKKMKRGGTPSPIPMPESVKKRRENRRTRNDMTSVSKEMMDYIKEQDAKKVKGYQNGGCVMSGRGGKFKGVS